MAKETWPKFLKRCVARGMNPRQAARLWRMQRMATGARLPIDAGFQTVWGFVNKRSNLTKEWAAPYYVAIMNRDDRTFRRGFDTYREAVSFIRDVIRSLGGGTFYDNVGLRRGGPRKERVSANESDPIHRKR